MLMTKRQRYYRRQRLYKEYLYKKMKQWAKYNY